jgi:hypothetical protein
MAEITLGLSFKKALLAAASRILASGVCKTEPGGGGVREAVELAFKLAIEIDRYSFTDDDGVMTLKRVGDAGGS